jgi:hypothetical protein
MKLTFILILPAIIVCLPIIGFLTFYRIDKKVTRRKVIIAGILCFLVGLVTPLLATAVSAKGLSIGVPPGEFLCATGAATFLLFGYLLTFFATPILTLILSRSTERKK